MTICPIAIAVGCKKCPAFKFCPLTTVLGDQEEKDEINPSSKVWEESYPTEWDGSTADEHLDKMDDLEKNNKEEVIPEKKKPLTKDERLALIKESAEKKSVNDID